MRIRSATEIFLKGNNEAILLLHSYTSHTRDMKKLATYLHERGGYTCYVPLYEGHGVQPEALLHCGVQDWWQNTESAYYFLRQQGYEKISVIGLSVGGIFALKLAEQQPIHQLIVMSVPQDRTPKRLKKRLVDYAKSYKQLEGKNEEVICKELIPFETVSLAPFQQFQQFILTTIQDVQKITAPTAIYYGQQDDILYEESANVLAENLSSKIINVKAFPNATHLMTLGKDQDALFREILAFKKNSSI